MGGDPGQYGSHGTAPSEYNIEVYAREFTASGESHPRLYYAKLVHEDDILGGDPHIVLGRFANNTRSDLLSLNLEATGQTKCPSNGVLPLTEADPNNTNRSKSVWLRIEVTDDLVEEKAKVRGTVAWDCASGSIESCNSVCQTSWVEDSDATMFDQQGDTGFGAHHKTHFATHFRAGSVPTP